MRIRFPNGRLQGDTLRNQASWLVHGIDSLAAYLAISREFDNREALRSIRCAVFLAWEENDPTAASAAEVYDALAGPKTLVRFLVTEGAGDHCALLGARSSTSACSIGSTTCSSMARRKFGDQSHRASNSREVSGRPQTPGAECLRAPLAGNVKMIYTARGLGSVD
ncbi:MAG: hypothetical protein WCA06_20880 [Terrimicrobiaceae bacterium]